VYFVLFLLLLSVLLSISIVQTQVAKIATDKINKDFGTNLVIKKLDFSLFGNVELKGVEIRDHHKDTLIFVESLNTSILNFKKILENKVDLGNVSLKGAYFYMKTYKNETDTNLSVFIDSFDDGKPKNPNSVPFMLKSSTIYIEDLSYKLIDENKREPLLFSADKAGGTLENLTIVGANVSSKIIGMYFVDNRGLNVTNLTTDFLYSETAMQFQSTLLQTKTSAVNADIEFTYKPNDLQFFTDKVNIKADFRKSKLSVKDLQKFYDELRGNDILSFTGKINGTLNNFSANKLNLYSKNGMQIVGNLKFKNVINTDRGFVFEGDINQLKSNYNQLKNILPNVLGKTLPSDFQRLGNFTLSGVTKVTSKNIEATLTIKSEIGTTISDLQLTNIDDIDNATYSGDIELVDFDLGVFTNDPLLGKVSLKGDVFGKGFSLNHLSTTIIGKISEFEFKEYVYKNIIVNGQVQNKKFDGDLLVNDEHLKMDFKGLADLSSEIHKFNFSADISHIDLKETNLFVRDSIANLKGKININITGNKLDNIVGDATFKDVTYINPKKTYNFKEFKIVSTIKDSIKTIKIDSKDIVKGKLTGSFSFEELLPVTQNALGSMYTHYKPHLVAPHQFMNFDFTIYSQVVEVFYPKIFIDNNTRIRGRIKADKNQLKLTITSPKIVAYDNEITNILLRTDNQNKLYNSHLTADAIKTKYYNISKLNLLNITKKDTLFFKSVFKGGKEYKEDFNLDFFYTINQEKKSVVGIQKSTFNFKNNIWNINPKEDKNNKVAFNLKTNEFIISPFEFVSNKQKIAFKGVLKDSTYKDFQADFTDVNLESFLPSIDSLALKGTLNGSLDFVQKEGLYSPQGGLVINNFEVNKFKQGNLSLQVKGDNSYKKYSVNLSLEREDVKSIAATGFVDFSTQKPMVNLEVFLEDFKLNAFSPLGSNVLSKIRGSASGNFTLKGFLGNPKMNGSLALKNAGLMFPYLNVDYDFGAESSITLSGQSFVFDKISLTDVKHKTKGELVGNITHQNFTSWFLNLEIMTNNLLVLDTEDTEESLYYGTAFLNGTADISGVTESLKITINGSTEPGTIFVIPLKDIQTVDNYKLIHFKTKYNTDKDSRKNLAIEAMKGLSLDIDMEITTDAVAQVVIDKENGSQLTGSGTGNLKIEINTRGKFNMFGDFVIDNGVYDFKYGGIVNKPFKIVKGGTVSWDGSPFDANLDITAVYQTKANPAVLLENFNSNRNIPINLETRITGGLFSSKQELDIKLPNVDPTIASELEFILNDNDVNQKTTQFISLLAFGGFSNPDKINFDSNAVITSTASSAIAAAFSRILNNSDGKFQLGVDYKQGRQENDIENLNTDNQVDVSISTKVSDRVLINGKVGVPVGAKTQSSVVGEVKIEVLLNKEGNLKMVIFNRQNEIRYSVDEGGYTQGVGLSYQVNFNTLSDLLQKIGFKKKRKTFKKKIKKDTVISQHKTLVNFKKGN